MSVFIGATRARVWREVADLASHVEWMADAERIDFEGEARSGDGVRMRVHTKIGPLRTVDVIEVRDWVIEKEIGVVHRGLVSGHGRFELTPVAGGTRFTWRESLLFPLWLGGPVTAWLAGLILAGVWRRNLRNLKRRIEAG